MTGILGAGAYAPRDRVTGEEIAEAWGQFKAAGVNTTAVRAPDEDPVTMAYEAATRALGAADADPADLSYLGLATTNAPVEEESLLAHLAAMLGAPDDVTVARHTGSQSAGVGVFRAAIAELDEVECGLVVASDAPRGDPDEALGQGAGAGAAAFVLGPDAPAQVVDSASFSRPASGTRFRRRGEETSDSLGITAFDRTTFRETVTAAVEGLSFDPDGIDAAAVQASNGRRPYRVVDLLPVDSERLGEHATVHSLGDTGAASVPLSLARSLGDDVAGVLGVGFGSGAVAEAIVFDVSSPIPTALDLDGERDLDYASYARQRGEFHTSEPEGGGGYVSLPDWHRSLPQRYRLEAGRCRNCDGLNMPPTGACSHCRELVEYDPVELERTGTVEAVSVISQGGAPPEFDDLQTRTGEYATGIVAFDGPDGESASLPAMFVDVEPSAVSVGDRVQATIRRIYTQEGVARYGLKAAPADDTR